MPSLWRLALLLTHSVVLLGLGPLQRPDRHPKPLYPMPNSRPPKETP